MVSYANTNALSMLGGDDYSDVIDSLANFVTTNTPQTILSGADKTHQELNTFNNEVNIFGPLLVNAGSVEIQSSGTYLFSGNDTDMSLFATDAQLTGTVGSINLTADGDISIVRTANNGFTGSIALQSNGSINITTQDPLALGFGDITIDSAVDTYINTANNLVNTAVNAIYCDAGGAIYLRIGSIYKTEILNTETTNTNATITEVATTAFNVQNVSGTDKLNIAPTLTKNTNATITEVATTAFKVQNVDGTDNLNIAPTLTTNTNATITDVATTHNFQVVAGTNIASITAGFLSCNQNITSRKYLATDGNTIISCESGSLNASIPYVSVKKYSAVLNAYAAQYKTNSIDSVLTIGGVDTVATVMDWSIVTLNSNLPTQNFIASTEFNVTDGTNNKVAITPSLTTLTNTNVDVVAPLHAPTYHIGTTASSLPLLSHQVSAGRIISNQGIGTTNYYCNFGNNSLSLTSNFHRVPSGVSIVPKYCVVSYDTGVFTAAGTVSIVVTLVNGGTLATCYNSASATVLSGSNVSPSLAMTLVAALPAGSSFKIQVAVTSSVAITASTKNMYVTIYSQQT